MTKKTAVEFKGVTVGYLKNRGIMGVVAAVLDTPSLRSWTFIRKLLEWWSPGKKTVLQDVSFEIYAGETTGLIGGNGGGKSTAFKSIAGEFPPDKGELLVFGEKAGSPSLLGRVYGVGPDPELFPEYSGLVNAQCTGLWYRIGTEDIRERMIALREVVGLSEQDMYAAADTLSSGNRMKVSLARALAIVEAFSYGKEGQVLLVDEPTSFLDIPSTRKVLTAIRDVMTKRKDLTVIISTNNANDLTICDRLVCIQEGSLVEDDETLQKIKTGLAHYEEAVLKPVNDLLTRSVSVKGDAQSKVAKPKKKASKNYKGNPLMWRNWEETKANPGLSATLLLSLFVYNWMYLGGAGPTLPNVILVTMGVLLSALNRSAYRIFETERGYYMNSRSLILSPLSRLEHAVMHAVSSMCYNLVYCLAVFFILCLLYRGELASQFTLRVDPMKILAVGVYLPGALCFVYGMGLFFSPLNMWLRSNNTFFLTIIIPMLTISTSGYYGQAKNLPFELRKFGEFNPLTYLSQALHSSSANFDWNNLAFSSSLGITWLIAGFLAYSFGFKAAVIAKRVR